MNMKAGSILTRADLILSIDWSKVEHETHELSTDAIYTIFLTQEALKHRNAGNNGYELPKFRQWNSVIAWMAFHPSIENQTIKNPESSKICIFAF